MLFYITPLVSFHFQGKLRTFTSAEEEFVAWLFAAVKPPAPKMVAEGCGRAARVLAKDLNVLPLSYPAILRVKGKYLCIQF